MLDGPTGRHLMHGQVESVILEMTVQENQFAYLYKKKKKKKKTGLLTYQKNKKKTGLLAIEFLLCFHLRNCYGIIYISN